LCRPAPAGCQGEGGDGPVAGRLADAGRALEISSSVLASLHFQREAKPVPDDATRRLRLPVSGRPESGTRLPVGCGHHPAKIGPRASCATPHVSVSNGTCTPNPFSERRRPRAALRTRTPDQPAGRCFRRGIWPGLMATLYFLRPRGKSKAYPALRPRCCLHRHRALCHLWATAVSSLEPRHEPRRHNRPDPPLP
jgi:hypothetical protein